MYYPGKTIKYKVVVDYLDASKKALGSGQSPLQLLTFLHGGLL